MRGWGVIIALLGLSATGLAKKEELPPLPVWDPGDEELVKEGEIVPGMDLFRTDIDAVALPTPRPDPEALIPVGTPHVVEEEEIPTRIARKYHETYFGRRPASYLTDPQELLSRQEFRDRESFLDYHAGDSEINLYIYLFDVEQELPEGLSIEGLIENYFSSSGSTALVFYFLGAPERTQMALSEDICTSISGEERARALETAVEEAFEKSESYDQLDNFSVELSIRLYWFEKSMSGPMIVPISSGASGLGPRLAASAPVVKMKGSSAENRTNFLWGVGFLLLATVLGWVGRVIAKRRVRYVFPKTEVGPLLGAPHAAGVGAVISFSNAQVPPSQQRDLVPDYLQRM